MSLFLWLCSLPPGRDWIKGQQVHCVIEPRSATKVFTHSAMFNCIWDWYHANSSLLLQEVRKSGSASLNCRALLEEDTGMYAKHGQKVYHAKMQEDQSIFWTDIQICLKQSLKICWFQPFDVYICRVCSLFYIIWHLECFTFAVLAYDFSLFLMHLHLGHLADAFIKLLNFNAKMVGFHV